jgi:phenylalanyl-tRNA synthetase beta chain
MYLSLEWISDYVDVLDLSPDVVADKLTLYCAEVEGVETVRRSIADAVVGHITNAEEVSTDLKKITVECGSKTYTTVTSAPNARAGMATAFAPAGASISDGVTVEARTMQGVASEGIVCSAKELGLSGFHEGIIELPRSTEAGTPVADLIPGTDTVVEIDNKSLTHRPDLWGHYGFAREIAAIFRRPLKQLPVVDLSAYKSLPEYPVRIEDPQNCAAYCCMEFGNVPTQPAPMWMQARLHSVGQRSISLLVDLTNYIMFELGQPTHAFDADALHEVVVKPMGADGEIVTLDGETRKMKSDDLMIWNEKTPVAIAGVMGGANSEVSQGTNRLLLESANFKGSRVRRTANRLDLRSEASQRFEKSQPPVNASVAVARFARLMTDAGLDPEITSRLSCATGSAPSTVEIRLPYQHLLTKMGTEVTREEVLQILSSLGFSASFQGEDLVTGTPEHRSTTDISIPEDIIEEVARIYGYDRVIPTLPEITAKPAPENPKLRREHRIQKLLSAAHQYLEVNSYGWFDSEWLSTIGYQPDNTLVLANPSAANFRVMRTAILPNLLKAVEENAPRRERFAMYEIGRVFRAVSRSDHVEHQHLCGLDVRPKKEREPHDHFYEVKAVLSTVLAKAGNRVLRFNPIDEAKHPWEALGQCARIEAGGVDIGRLGLLPERLAKVVGARSQIVWFEINLDELPLQRPEEAGFKPISLFPPSWQDFSILWPTDKTYAELQRVIDRFEDPRITSREFQYHYVGKGLPEGMASYTFRYWLGSYERTLSGEELEEFIQSFIDFLAKRGLSLRQ